MFKKTKIFLCVGFIIAYVLFVCTPLYAYETFNIDSQPVGYSPAGTWTYYYSKTDDYVSGYNHAFIGWDMTVPVPYYADGDHVSIYGTFSFQIPNTNLSDDWSFYVAPAGEYVLRNDNLTYYGTRFLDGFTSLGSPSVTSYRGETTFNYMPNNQCNLRYLMLKYNDGNYTTFTFYCLFDLNLRFPTIEMRPFRFGVIDASQLTSGTGVSWLVYNKNYNWELLDTQLYFLLDNKLDTIANSLQNLNIDIDLSGLENLINTQINQVIQIQGQLESLVDDSEPDEDLTEWANQATAFESVVSNLNDIEESLLGTISDFTFPDVPNQTANLNIVRVWFENPITQGLMLAFLIMTIAMLLLF